jgi:hypothetical protein
MDHVKCTYGYLYKMKDAEICMRTQEPDYSDVQDEEYDWAKSVYGEVSELIPKDVLELLGGYVTLMHYADANLYNDMLTGHLVTGILHFLNKMPIDCIREAPYVIVINSALLNNFLCVKCHR